MFLDFLTYFGDLTSGSSSDSESGLTAFFAYLVAFLGVTTFSYSSSDSDSTLATTFFDLEAFTATFTATCTGASFCFLAYFLLALTTSAFFWTSDSSWSLSPGSSLSSFITESSSLRSFFLGSFLSGTCSSLEDSALPAYYSYSAISTSGLVVEPESLLSSDWA